MLQYPVTEDIIEHAGAERHVEDVALQEYNIVEPSVVLETRIDRGRVVEGHQSRTCLRQQSGEPTGTAAGLKHKSAFQIAQVPAGLGEPLQRQACTVDRVDLVGLEAVPLQ